MRGPRGLAVGLLLAGLATGVAAEEALVAHWSLDEERGRVALDSASGAEDAIGGFVERLPGVSGGALRFDGATTHVRRDAARAPALDEATWTRVRTILGEQGYDAEAFEASVQDWP